MLTKKSINLQNKGNINLVQLWKFRIIAAKPSHKSKISTRKIYKESITSIRPSNIKWSRLSRKCNRKFKGKSQNLNPKNNNISQPFNISKTNSNTCKKIKKCLKSLKKNLIHHFNAMFLKISAESVIHHP